MPIRDSLVRKSIVLMLRRLGVGPARRQFFLPWQRRTLMEALDIRVVLDVGANTGQYAGQLRAFGFSGEMYSFEPGAAPLSALRQCADRDPKWHVEPFALGRERGVATLHAWTGNESTASSLLEPTRGLQSLNGPPAGEDVAVKPLDEWLSSRSSIDPSQTLLKIDVQGSEASVLAGARNALPALAMVEMELPLREWYQGEASLGELMQVLGASGFVAAAIMTERFSEDWLGAVDVDALFIRSEASRVPIAMEPTAVRETSSVGRE